MVRPPARTMPSSIRPLARKTPATSSQLVQAGVGEVALAASVADLVELGDRDDLAGPDLADRRIDLEQRHAERRLAGALGVVEVLEAAADLAGPGPPQLLGGREAPADDRGSEA